MIVRSLACLSLLCSSARVSLAQQVPGHIRLRIGLIVPSTGDIMASSVARGVRLGAAEAKQTAELFGDEVDLFEAVGSGRQAIAAANHLLSGQQVQVLIAASPADVEAISEFAELHRLLFLNAASRAQSVRETCRRHTFHIEATDGMYAAAARMDRALQPFAPGTQSRSTFGQSDSVALWGSPLERFGASQINQRFRDKYHMEMDGSAWAGWAAVKIVAEAAMRARSTAPAKLAAYLESPTTQFDGHKGWPLTFRRGDHQLRQPLYAVTKALSNGGKSRFRDVPELRGNASAGSPDDGSGRSTDRMLDVLIAPADSKKCSRSGGR